MSTKVIAPLHGIRTTAHWHRTLHAAAQSTGCECDLRRWYYGRFSLFRFLFFPWQRSGRTKWFNETYDALIHDNSFNLSETNLPSIVAHSFGTYILGYALQKYPHIKFDRVILCGSILPTDFPLNELLERGQVTAVRNEYGTADFWSRIVCWFVKGTGASGRTGFVREHARLFQEPFSFKHSDYFTEGHMRATWIPFILNDITSDGQPTFSAHLSRPNVPWGLYLLYFMLLIIPAIYFAPWERVTHRAEIGEYQSALTAARQHITSLETALQNRTIQNATPPSVPHVPPTPALSEQDRAVMLDVFSSVDHYCINPFVNTYNQLDQLLSQWQLSVKANRQTFVKELSDIDSHLQSASACISKFQNEYVGYTEVSKILAQPYTRLVQDRIEEFSRAISDLPQTLPTDFDVGLRIYAGRLSVEATNLVNWLGDMRREVALQITELSGRR